MMEQLWIGIFTQGTLVEHYPNLPEYYAEALDTAQFCTEDSGVLHEVKLFSESDIK